MPLLRNWLTTTSKFRKTNTSPTRRTSATDPTCMPESLSQNDCMPGWSYLCIRPGTAPLLVCMHAQQYGRTATPRQSLPAGRCTHNRSHPSALRIKRRTVYEHSLYFASHLATDRKSTRLNSSHVRISYAV